jgi:two-component system sensor histidine kinase PilS (NtrC family)
VTKVKGLIFFRFFLTIILLGSYILFKIGPYPFPYYHLIKYLVYSVFILSIVYLLLLKYIKNLRRFAYIQLIIDSILIIFLIFMTGGVESWFSFLMVLNVIAGAIVVGRPAGYVIATVLGILYGTLMDLQFYRIIPIGYEASLKATHFLYNIFIHISALYLVAYLAGHLISRLEKTSKTLEMTQQDLSELRALNTIIVENVPSGIITTNQEGKIIAFNTSAEFITGITRNEAIGKSLFDLFPFLRNGMEKLIASDHSFATKGVLRTEGVIDTKRGQKIIGITIQGFQRHQVVGEVTGGLIGVFQDLTEIKKIEEEAKRKEKLAAVGELSRNIAHEIRNPLASLKGSIEILLENRVPEEQKRKLMEIAIKEMDRLNKIITDFLLYTRPARLELKRFDIISLINEVIWILKTSPKAERIEINRMGPPKVEIVADESQLKQVFLNLGYNALEAMSETSKEGRLDIGVKEEAGNIIITFSDTGPGIKKEDHEKIFYPFYSTKEGGSGLGLSIAYKIIEEHNGKISVKPHRVGGGSNGCSSTGATFEIVLPKEQEIGGESKS